MEFLPLAVADSENYRNFTKLSKVSSRTLKKYLKLVRDQVTVTISEYIQLNFPRFAVEFDGWSDGYGNYLVGFFAVLPNRERILMAIEPFPDETNHSADNHVNLFITVLANFGLTTDNIICFVADNAYVNASIGEKLKLPVIGK